MTRSKISTTDLKAKGSHVHVRKCCRHKYTFSQNKKASKTKDQFLLMHFSHEINGRESFRCEQSYCAFVISQNRPLIPQTFPQVNMRLCKYNQRQNQAQFNQYRRFQASKEARSSAHKLQNKTLHRQRRRGLTVEIFAASSVLFRLRTHFNSCNCKA